MWTTTRINDFIKRYNFKSSHTNSEIKELPKLLSPNEELLGLLEGNLKSIAGRKQAGIGLGIITDKRVIFYRKSIIGTTTKEEIPLKRISSASFRSGIVLGTVSVTSNSNEALIDDCNKTYGLKFVDIITNLLETINNTPLQNNQIQLEDNLSKIEKLFNLKEKGIITEEEFISQKTVLLNNI